MGQVARDDRVGGTRDSRANQGKYAWQLLTLHDPWEIRLAVALIEETVPPSVLWQATFEFP